MRRRHLVLVGILLIVVTAAGAQEISEKKEIAIFRLSDYGWDIPSGAMGSIDSELQSVFINLGRFDVIGLSYRLGEGDVTEFMDRIREYKQENVEIPEQFQMGQEIFTEGDMNRLIGSFIVVIPAVSYFDVKEEKETKLIGRDQVTGYSVEIKTSFTFVNVEEAKTFAQFFVETSGSDEDRERAIQDAIDSIPARLEFEITKVPEFTLKTGVLEVNGGEIVLELGRNMGIRLGYEFVVIDSRVLGSGRTLDAEGGLMVVKEVGEEVSLATLLYGRPDIGDQLQEVPRFGVEITPYADFLFNPISDDSRFFSVLGVTGVGTKGFYDIRPMAGLEVPLPVFVPEGSLLPALWIFGFPFNVYVGGEYVVYIRRVQIRPQAAIGAGFLIPWLIDTDDPVLSHIGGFLGVQASYLLNRDWAVSAELGYKLWYGIYDGLLDLLDITGETSYSGVSIKIGVSRKT